MAVWFTADTHFGHAGALALYRRPFASVAEMDAAMQARWNDVVQPDDDVWHLGDFALRTSAPAAAALLRALNGRKHLITGNNDPPEIAAPSPEWFSVQAYAETTVDSYRLVLCHYAFRTWNGMAKGALNLHGHSHGRLKPLPRQTDVGVDAWDFRPVPVQLMRGADSAQSQGAPRRSGRRLADQVVVDPLGDQPARLVDRGLGMVDAKQRRAGLECRHVIRPDLAQLAVGGDHGPFTPAADLALLPLSPAPWLEALLAANHSHEQEHNQSRIERQVRSPRATAQQRADSSIQPHTIPLRRAISDPRAAPPRRSAHASDVAHGGEHPGVHVVDQVAV